MQLEGLTDTELHQLARGQAIEELWRRGNLRFKRHETQIKLAEIIERALVTARKFFLLLSRRSGKSFDLFCRACEQCIRQPGSRVLYLAPWANDAADIANDIALQVLEDCPADIRPAYNSQAKEYRFPNGSLIRLKGVNGEHARYLRGGAYHLIVLDECGLMDDLEHVVSDICMPMTATTNGRILLASTPPRTPSHESATIYEELASVGAVAIFTLRDSPHIPYEVKLQLLIEAGEDPSRVVGILAGTLEPETTTAKREYFCQFVTDESSAVLPEFPRVKAKIVVDIERPEYYDAYVAMDPGFRDRTGVLFGYYDFRRSALVIEDELLLQHPNTNDIAQAIKTKEAALWKYKPPHLRVSDVDLRLIADLQAMHRLTFQKTRKENSLGAVNLMRNMLQAHEILINPRCVNLIRQCQNAIWNTKATDFARPEQENSIDGHYDLVAALKYMVRNVNRNRNPYPDYWFQIGGPAGPVSGTYVPRRASRRERPNLYGTTPLGRKLAKARQPAHRRIPIAVG